MPNIIFNIPLYMYFTGITTYIYTELALKLTAMASVAQAVERSGLEIQGRGFNSQPEALELHFFATGLGWILKCIYFSHSNLPYFKKHLR